MDVVREKALKESPKRDFITAAALNDIGKVNHDAYTTAKTVMALSILVALILVAFLVSTIQERISEQVWEFNTLMKGPALVFAISGFLTFIMLLVAWHKTGLMGRMLIALPLYLVVGFIVWAVASSTTKVDAWALPTFDFTFDGFFGTRSKALCTVLFFLAAIAFMTNFLTGRVRGDRLNISSVALLSYAALAYMSYFGFHYLYSLVVRTLIEYGITDQPSLGGYLFIAVCLVLFVILLMDRLISYFLSFMTSTPIEYESPPIEEAAETATKRTFQFIKWSLITATVLPAILTWYQTKSAVPSIGNVSKEWGGVAATVAISLPIVVIAAMIGVEIVLISPAIYGLVSSLLTGVFIFMVGTQFIYWTDYTGIILFALGLMVLMKYFFTQERGNSVLIGALLSVGFILINTTGQALVGLVQERTNQVLGYWPRVGLYLIPLVVILVAWIFKTRRSKTSVSLPLFFFMLVGFYTFIYTPTQEQGESLRPYNPDQSRLANVALELVVALSIIIPVVAIAKFVYVGAESVNYNLTRGKTPVAEGVGIFIIYGILAFASALVYAQTQTNNTIRDFIVEGQEDAAVTYDLVTTDIRLGADWNQLLNKN
nr:hypothetical protein [Sicyoidochytrium minutum DNA virus]